MKTPPVLHITSRDNELVARVRRLGAKPGAYREAGLVWLEGDHLVRALLARGGVAQQALITVEAWEGRPDLRELALGAQRVAVLPEALMKLVSTLESPAPIGVLMPLAAAASGTDLGPVLEPCATDSAAPAAMVVLDRLQDPGNVGSILRSAAALGVPQVLALQGTVALWSPKVLRAGMGAHFGLRLVEGLSSADLRPLASRLVVTGSHEAQPLHTAALPAHPAWVLGHEGGGVQAELLAMAALRVRIPQPGGEESLNVAAAAAVCLYEGVRRSLVAQ